MATVSSTASSELVTLAQRLMQADMKPLQSMQTQRTNLTDHAKVYTDLASRLSDLRRLASSFAGTGSSNPLRTIKVIGTDDSVVGVTVSLGASPGAHSLRVDQVAARHSLASDSLVDDDTSLSDRGALTGGRLDLRLVSGGEAREITVEVSEGQTNAEVLRTVAQAIIDQGDGIVASVVQTAPNESRLLIQAPESGTDARITAIEDSRGSLLSTIGLAGRESGDQPIPSTVQAAADSIVDLDGLTVRGSSNELSGVIPGVTLTLHSTSSESRVFRVERDVSAIVDKVNDFITKYNATLSSVRDVTRGSDSTGANRGTLAGDVTIQRLRSELRTAVTAPVEVTDSNLTTLTQLGITADRQGQLTLSDRSALERALTEQPDSVEALISGADGVGGRLSSLLERYSKTGGILSAQQTSIQNRITSINTRIR
ncbi:MAG: flagellar filament capping protein FliD, partial [Candidatus Eisenbacteria bacterium]